MDSIFKENSTLDTDFETREQHLLSVLDEIGTSPIETKAYIFLAERGSKSLSEIANHHKLNRAHLHAILEKLHQRGLVSTHSRGRVKYFTATPVNQIDKLLTDKELLTSYKNIKIGGKSPKLKTPKKYYWSNPVTQYWNGAEARALLFRDILLSEKEQKYLFCFANNSVLFDGEKISREVIKQILLLGGDDLHICLTFQSKKDIRDCASIDEPNVSYIPMSIPVEFLVSQRAIRIFGPSKDSCRILSVEQDALAETLLLLTKEVIKLPTNLPELNE